MLGGGLGAQPLLASIVEEFLPEDQLIPYIEAIIRVFDRHGERNNRNKAPHLTQLQRPLSSSSTRTRVTRTI